MQKIKHSNKYLTALVIILERIHSLQNNTSTKSEYKEGKYWQFLRTDCFYIMIYKTRQHKFLYLIYSIKHGQEEVSGVVGAASLQNGAQSLQPHPCVHMVPG